MLPIIGSASTFDAVTSGVSNLMTIVNTMITTIVSNEILCALFVSGFVYIGIGIVRRLKRA